MIEVFEWVKVNPWWFLFICVCLNFTFKGNFIKINLTNWKGKDE